MGGCLSSQQYRTQPTTTCNQHMRYYACDFVPLDPTLLTSCSQRTQQGVFEGCGYRQVKRSWITARNHEADTQLYTETLDTLLRLQQAAYATNSPLTQRKLRKAPTTKTRTLKDHFAVPGDFVDRQVLPNDPYLPLDVYEASNSYGLCPLHFTARCRLVVDKTL